MISSIPPGPPYKRCTGCQDVKRLSAFYHNKEKKDGHQSRCKACQAINQKLYLMRPEVAERRRAARREYCKRPEIREYLNWGQTLRWRENPRYYSEASRRYRQRYPDRVRAMRQWYKDNPGKSRREEKKAQETIERRRELDRLRYQKSKVEKAS